MAHGALPLPQGYEESVELLVKYSEAEQTAELFVSDSKITYVNGKEVLKYTKAKVNCNKPLEVGLKLTFNKFFVVVKK